MLDSRTTGESSLSDTAHTPSSWYTLKRKWLVSFALLAACAVLIAVVIVVVVVDDSTSSSKNIAIGIDPALNDTFDTNGIFSPSASPTLQSANVSSMEPTAAPSNRNYKPIDTLRTPSSQPSSRGSSAPSISSSAISSAPPSKPSSVVSSTPTGNADQDSSVHPSFQPSRILSLAPTERKPTLQSSPSLQSSSLPSGRPSSFASSGPSSMPSITPSLSISSSPSVLPSMPPTTVRASEIPSYLPSDQPSPQTTTATTTAQPTKEPSSWDAPTISPSTAVSTMSPPQPQPPALTKRGSFEILERVPHDATAFTQGLVIVTKPINVDNGTTTATTTTTMFEGTGLYGRSELRIVDLPTGNVLIRHRLEDQYFGEGIAYYTTTRGEGRIVQLTWKAQKAFIYDSDSLQLLDTFQFTTTFDEGWGITLQGASSSSSSTSSSFIVSDGSSNLHVWEGTDWSETRRIPVASRLQRADGTVTSIPQFSLNELEWDPSTDTILANIWQSDHVLRIDPSTGFVLVDYDLSLLFPDRPGSANVLNGIALVPNTPDEFWVTGKLWPYMFRVRLFVVD